MSDGDRDHSVRERGGELTQCSFGRAFDDLTGPAITRAVAWTDVDVAVRAGHGARLVTADRVDGHECGGARARDEEYARRRFHERGAADVVERRSSNGDLHAGTRKAAGDDVEHRRRTAWRRWRSTARGKQRCERGAGSGLTRSCAELPS